MSEQHEGPVHTSEPGTDSGGTSRQTSWGVAVVAVLAMGALFWPSGDGSRALPPGDVVDGDGQPVAITSRIKPVTLVHFWSTWCLPCLDEVPKILRLEKNRTARDPDFALMMVAVADDREEVATFMATHTPDRNYLLYDDDWTIAKRFKTRKLPETHLVIDGRIVDTFVGVVDWNGAEVGARIDEAINTARQGTG